MGLKGDALDLTEATRVISEVKNGRAMWTEENRHLKGLFSEYRRT